MSEHCTPSHEQHEQAAASKMVSVGLVTVSDTRTEETDKNGIYLKAELERLGHKLAGYTIIPDEADAVDKALSDLLQTDVQIIIFNGGTGIARRDTTIDVLEKRLDKELPGFGEIFRMLSYEDIGAAGMLSRAAAGVVDGRALFSTPGSHGAVRLAWEKLIAPQLKHLAWELLR